MANVTIAVAASAGEAGTTTVTGGTLTKIDQLPIVNVKQISIRLEVTTGMTGTTPTMDIYVQRATQASPGADDWDDWYAFPQVTTSAIDRVVHGPLPLPQDVDGTLASASHLVVQETLTADTLLAGAIGEQIRIREKIGGTDITVEAVYNIHIIANG